MEAPSTGIDPGRFYRPREAQDVLGIRQTTFFSLVKAGEIETRKIGRATVVPGSSLRNYFDKIMASGRAAAR